MFLLGVIPENTSFSVVFFNKDILRAMAIYKATNMRVPFDPLGKSVFSVKRQNLISGTPSSLSGVSFYSLILALYTYMQQLKFTKINIMLRLTECKVF